MKTLEERKAEDINLSEICTQRRYKKEIKKNEKSHEKLKRGTSQEYQSSYKQATTQAKIQFLLKQKQKHYSY